VTGLTFDADQSNPKKEHVFVSTQPVKQALQGELTATSQPMIFKAIVRRSAFYLISPLSLSRIHDLYDFKFFFNLMDNISYSEARASLSERTITQDALSSDTRTEVFPSHGAPCPFSRSKVLDQDSSCKI
jgi:hypothetical protein